MTSNLSSSSISRSTVNPSLMDNPKVCGGTDYLDKFDAFAYLEKHGPIENSRHMLRCYHSAFQELPNGISVLDYASGSSIRGTISAANKASEIILSDYSSRNLKVARDWLDNKPCSFDWDPHFSYVVKDLEGGGEDEVVKRKEQVRKVVTGFAHCDLTQEPPIEEKYLKLYDVVIESFVLVSIAKTKEEYFDLVSRLAQLVKPGGYILLYGVVNSTSYTVGNYTFSDFPVTTTLIRESLERCHFSVLDMDKSHESIFTRAQQN